MLPNPRILNLLVKRSKARAAIKQWKEALDDAEEVIRADKSCHDAYGCKHIALHGMGRYDEAIKAYDSMLSLMEQSTDPQIRQLRSKYVSTSDKQKAIEYAVQNTIKSGPLVLIDVITGRLCDKHTLPGLISSDPTFKELISFMTEGIDGERIQETVDKCFGYVMFSHVWGNGIEEEKKNEPLYKDVKNSPLQSVHKLPDTDMNKKLKNFCAKVLHLGYRWAWSDTCCIDKSNDAILNQSLRSMYKWYEDSDATLVYLGDVTSDLGDLLNSLWMTRAWTLQEALAPKRIIFYDQGWRLYHGITCDNHEEHTINHKKHDIILQELANATGVRSETLVAFRPESLGVREKLRLASTRKATIEEDRAYSLIGIFRSDIIPRYGEGEDALGHLLGGIVAHLGEVTVLAWTGTPSSYNSCLPSTLAVYDQTPYMPQPLDEDMQQRTTQLSTALSKDDALDIYHKVAHLPPARFANRRLQLPCIVFHVKGIEVKNRDNNESCYQAKVSGLGMVEFTTACRLPLTEPRRLVFVHPWIRDIRGLQPHGSVAVNVSGSDVEWDREQEMGRDRGMDEELGATPGLHTPPSPSVDEHVLALEMIVRFLQSFNALLLLHQPTGEYKRVATDNKIVVQSRDHIKLKDIHAQVLDVL